MIHPTAVIHPGASIAESAHIGAFTIIDEHVEIGEETWVGPHVVINGHTTIGRGNKIYQFASVGEANQDKKYAGEPTRTVIGDDNIIRESCTIHRGTTQDRGVTTIGNNNLLMAYTHVAHDCILGNNIIVANSSNLAGHVVVDDFAILGGFSGIHQFCHIGAHAFIGIRSNVTQDILPFVLYADKHPRAINTEGLKRRGFSKTDIGSLRKAYRLIFRQGLTLDAAAQEIRKLPADSNCLEMLIDFIDKSERGLAR